MLPGCRLWERRIKIGEKFGVSKVPKLRSCIRHAVPTARQESKGIVDPVVAEEEGACAENVAGGVVA